MNHSAAVASTLQRMMEIKCSDSHNLPEDVWAKFISVLIPIRHQTCDFVEGTTTFWSVVETLIHTNNVFILSVRQDGVMHCVWQLGNKARCDFTTTSPREFLAWFHKEWVSR